MSIACDPKIMETNRVQNSGLKGLISKPHNLYSIKDDKGEITEWKMEMVYTPFKKSDISVTVSENILSVEIGSESTVDQNDETLIYKGISSKTTKFSISLSDKIDEEKITAKAEDGILTIIMPVKKTVSCDKSRRIIIEQ